MSPGTKREAPRIPFGNFVEQGVVPPGTRLFDRHKRVSAAVGADGTIVAGENRGSIHKVQQVRHYKTPPPAMGGPFGTSSGTGILISLDMLRASALSGVPMV